LIRGKIAHSLSRRVLELHDKAVVCIDKTTDAILFLEADMGQDFIKEKNLENCSNEVIEFKPKEFVIPDFVDTHFQHLNMPS
jgi:hypothetical protein